MKIMNSSHFRLPSWSKILVISTFTTLIFAVFELLLELILVNSYEIYAIRETLYSDKLGCYLMPFIVALGEGVLAVYIGERWLLTIAFNPSTLWALFICLCLGLYLKHLLAIPPLLVDMFNEKNIYNKMTLVGILVGVFWRGKRHWQNYRRG